VLLKRLGARVEKTKRNGKKTKKGKTDKSPADAMKADRIARIAWQHAIF